MAKSQTDSRPARRRRKPWIVVTALVGLVLLVKYAGQAFWHIRWEVAHRLAAELPGQVTSRDIEASEPSGVAYHPQRNSILVASDAGFLVEFDLDFRKLRSWRVKGDLEGIALHPDGSIAYIADEDNGAIIEFDLNSEIEIRRTPIDFDSDPDFAGQGSGNEGLEGLAFCPAHLDHGPPVLVGIIERDPPRWIELAFDQNADRWRIVRSLDVKMTRLNGIEFDDVSNRWIVVSSKERTARCVDLTGHVSDAVRLPGRLPEGICILPDGRSILVHDSGGVTVVPDLSRWIRSPDRFHL